MVFICRTGPGHDFIRLQRLSVSWSWGLGFAIRQPGSCELLSALFVIGDTFITMASPTFGLAFKITPPGIPVRSMSPFLRSKTCQFGERLVRFKDKLIRGRVLPDLAI